ncbi:MAG TPA: GNAT family N-acetyltransferase [Acidimicrobiales bacterium]|nr:GNAT family N-acetyltransferase [Acidimicrobiales bacterium]
MRIREATPDDLAEIMAITRELAVFEELEEHLVATAEDLGRALFGPQSVITVSLVVDDDGTVAGHALWYRTFSTFLGRPGIWLEDLFVREPYRRRGYGRALLEHLRSLSEGRVEWDVLDWNATAIAFYEGLGAKPVVGWTKFRWT